MKRVLKIQWEKIHWEKTTLKYRKRSFWLTMVRLEEFPLINVGMKQLPVIHILGCVTFLATGLVINMVQLVTFLVLFKINKDLFRRLNYYLMYGLYGYLLCLTVWWSGSRIKMRHPLGIYMMVNILPSVLGQ